MAKLENLVLCKIYQTRMKPKNNQSSMHHNVVDYSLPSCANTSGAYSSDSAVGEREHVKAM
ncbi:unnamed protein product [Ilex paraguariensis]|uniref:Uncharacterized protein n=1 Tax=Ilex paraguariensis TaxID=185542 RepID=A0ABC8UEJ1_9AQUA